MARATLATRLQTRDRARFVGRRQELSLIEALLTDDPAANVVHVHGPAGIGKSTLLREVARRAQSRGWTHFMIDGRDLAPVPDSLESAVADALTDPRPLLLLDNYEHIAAADGYIRRGIAPRVPERGLVVIAGRRAPDPAWFEHGWEHLTVAIELRGLGEQDARELLHAYGVHDESRASTLIGWARGWPLALSLAASAPELAGLVAQGGGAAASEATNVLVRRLVGSDFSPTQLAVLGVASIARVTTRAMVEDVLPEADADPAYDWLAALTVTEPRGDGVTLHDLVRSAVRDELRRREPERERDLRRRVADHLYARAIRDRLILSIDLAHLVETPAIRWGYGWVGSERYRIDELRADDGERLGALLADRGATLWWESTRVFLDQAPDRVAVARDAADRACGYMIAVTPRNAPGCAERDVLLGPWLADARSRTADGNAVLWRDSIDLSGEPRSGVQAMLGVAGILRSALSNPRYAYLPINPRLSGATDFAASLGARHLPELDVQVGETPIECHLLDYGPGGVLGMLRDVIHRETGFAASSGPPTRSVADHVREVLRQLHQPVVLAESELARGPTPAERASSVRRLIEQAADAAFGDTPDEQLLRRTLVRGYLDPAPSHELAAAELHLSRATYFRRLRLAVDRVAEYIAAGR